MRVKGQNLHWDESMVTTKVDQSEASWTAYFHKPYKNDWAESRMKARQRKMKYQLVAEGWKEHE